MENTKLHIEGKDYLTEKEAAHYCCVSPVHFRRNYERYGILPTSFMGKKVYRLSDLRKAMEGSWQHYRNKAANGQ
mgnify:CR=1 FL=1